MPCTQTQPKLLNPKFITSGQTDRYLRLEIDHLTPTERGFLSYLKSFIMWGEAKRGNIRTVEMKIETMCQKFNRSRATIQRWLSKLTKSGEILAERQFWPNGREKVSFYTFPNLCSWITNLKGYEQLDELKAEDDDNGNHQAADADKSEAPTKQGLSSSKKITYIRFSDFGRKDFLNISGSVKYVPRLVGIIRKVRPGVDPDVIFNFFREWISKPEFVLRKGCTYVGIFWGFVKRCKVPFDGPYTPKVAKSGQEARQAAAKPNYDEVKPADDGTPESKLRLALFDEAPAVYRNWFDKAVFETSDQMIRLAGKTMFETRYIAQHHENLVKRLGHALGLSVSVAR